MTVNPSKNVTAICILAAGVGAAMHIGKLPPALPVLGQALGVTLLEAGFLLSSMQLAGMLLGLLAVALGSALGA